MSVKTNHITIRKSSGFNFSITTSIVNTKQGAIRSIEIIDHEIQMKGLQDLALDRMLLTFNENKLDTNTKQIKQFCKFVLKDIAREEDKKKILKLSKVKR